MNQPTQETLVQLGLPARLSRRRAMQWVMATVAAASLPSKGFGDPAGATITPQEHALTQPAPSGKGYGGDAKLIAIHQPGDLWPLTFDDAQRAAAIALADVIIPKDAHGPAASEVGVVAMIDEWISAPYPQQQSDRAPILEGLAWIEAESTKRFEKSFALIEDEQRHAICDDICFQGTAKADFKKGADFFARFRTLAASAYYGTPAGWQAIGYVGNVPLAHFDGPPAAVLEKLGVTQTVKSEAV